jgi:hypothetical protein
MLSPVRPLEIEESVFRYHDNFINEQHSADVTTAICLHVCPPVLSSVRKESPSLDKDGKGGVANMNYGSKISLETEFSSHNQMDALSFDQPETRRPGRSQKVKSSSSYRRHVTVNGSDNQTTTLVNLTSHTKSRTFLLRKSHDVSDLFGSCWVLLGSRTISYITVD